MAKPPEGITILTVEPRNYDEIIERSQNNDSPKEPYTREDLVQMRSEARANNKVALILFMDPGFWLVERNEEWE